LIRFIYDEMSPEEANDLLDAMVKDEELWSRFENIQNTAEQVANLSFDPSEHSVEKIKEYAHQASAADLAKDDAAPVSSFKAVFRVGKLPVNLNAVVALSLGIFITLGVIGSAYRLSRQPQDKPDNSIVQQTPLDRQVQPAVPVLNWEGGMIDQDLSEIREALETIKRTESSESVM
jgi:hypothetical protein